MANTNTWVVIINPTSGNGRSKKVWPQIEQLLETHQFDFQYAFTDYPKHSEGIVHKAIQEGVLNFISVGGDGTLHNIVNAIMTQDLVVSSKVTVGIIPIGTGNDWVKTHGIPNRIEEAIQIIKNGETGKQDIGKIEFINKSIAPIYFNNLAGVGFDGHVVSKVQKYKHIGALAYLVGALLSLFSFKNFNSNIVIGSKVVSGKTLMILVGLCKYSGGGMQLTKTPNPFDGLFDISIAQDFGRFEIIRNLSNLFNGEIINYKKVLSYKSSSIIIQTNLNASLPFVQADGELIGVGDIEISLMPSAFSFYYNQNIKTQF